MNSGFYAHTPDGKPANPPTAEWQALDEHLRETALLAEKFAAAAFPALPTDLADAMAFKDTIRSGAPLAGWWHDLGKYRAEFGKLLRGLLPKGNPKTRHKQAGAAKAYESKRPDVALAIAGHHVGLPDLQGFKDLLLGGGEGIAVAKEIWPIALKDCPDLQRPVKPLPIKGQQLLLFDIAVRFLFSCLVDADWQNTSAYKRRVEKPPQPPEPEPPPLEPGVLLQRVLAHIDGKADQSKEPALAAVRREVLDKALAAAKLSPGLFTLTVPTGGGKTLSGLAFALAHAKKHSFRRVIYVAPFLSIIEQNARAIRNALGVGDVGFVLEHHSLAELADDEDSGQTSEAARRAENWDAPFVITTNVQFFESLFSNRPSKCRKLHNIARSVVLLDECQALPPDLLATTCSMLGQLAEVASCSLVLCTATQPALNRRPELPEGLENVREITPADMNLFGRLRRVKVDWLTDANVHLSWEEVAKRMLAEKAQAALCILNTRKAAQTLFDKLRAEGCADAWHLSTCMCPAHRLEVLDLIRMRLLDKKPCFLVSTQLIEAGVDVDFPLVLREMAPLEAIVQSAGRCNRERLLNAPDGWPGGRVILFRSEQGGLPSDLWYKAGRAVVEQDFLAAGRKPDIDRPEDIQEYFRRLYRSGKLDPLRIQALRQAREFAAVAKNYRLIDDETLPVLVPTWEAKQEEIEVLIDQVRKTPSRNAFRQLAKFQVNMRAHEVAKAGEMVESQDPNLRVWQGKYDQFLGVVPEG
jgi:CRISPR-associated endonuclease/helicase Cas3